MQLAADPPALCAADMTLALGYLASYQGHGMGKVQCVANCTCAPAILDSMWSRNASMQGERGQVGAGRECAPAHGGAGHSQQCARAEA